MSMPVQTRRRVRELALRHSPKEKPLRVEKMMMLAMCRVQTRSEPEGDGGCERQG